MNKYKVITQKKWFLDNEDVLDEFGNRKVDIQSINCDYIEYNGDIIDLNEEHKKYLNDNNIPFEGDKFYGPLKSILFKNKNDELVVEVNVFGDPYWELYKLNLDEEKLIGNHQCKFNIKQYKDQLKNNTL